jgi:arylsulfatase A-like enzyme
VVLSSLVSTRAQTNLNHGSVTNPPSAPRRPNIILILADNVGYSDLGCYGQTKIKTPNLDLIASKGIRFTSFYAGSPHDEASRASFLTGLEPKHIDASFSHPLPTDAFTLAAMLKERGYHTGLMGEWNLGDTPPVQPNAKGFEEFAGFFSQSHARDYYSDNIYRQDTTTGSNRLEALPENWDNVHGRYTPGIVGQGAGYFIRVNAPDRFNHYTPFFLCLAYAVPHNGLPPKDSPYSKESWSQAEKDRAAMITHLDGSIGYVINALMQARVDTNTVIIFTSVGGPQKEGAMDPKFFESAGPLRGEAGSVYEGGIRVPMIAYWPARIKPGQVSDFPCAAWDIMPTAAEIAFMKPPEKTDGISILPILTGRGEAKAHKSFNWESHGDSPAQALRMDDWKIVRVGTNAPSLYNLKTDLSEKNDVAEKNPEVFKKLKALLDGGTK